MNASQKGAGAHFLHDVRDRSVGVIRRGTIVEREKHPGDDLRDEKKEESRAKNIGESRTPGNWFIEIFFQHGMKPSSRLEPGCEPKFHGDSTNDFFGRDERLEILVSNEKAISFGFTFELIHPASWGSGNKSAI